MFSTRSGSFQLSSYDLYAPIRAVVLFVLAGLVVNIDAFQAQLVDWNVSPFFMTMILWGLVDLGRRFIIDNRPPAGGYRG